MTPAADWSALNALLLNDDDDEGERRGSDDGERSESDTAPIEPTPGSAATSTPERASVVAFPAKGQTLREKADDIAHQMLGVVQLAVTSGEIDYDDAVRALPVLHRVIEHGDKMDMARNGGGTILPIINITFGSGAGEPAISIRSEPARLETLDVDALEVEDEDIAPEPQRGLVATTDATELFSRLHELSGGSDK